MTAADRHASRNGACFTASVPFDPDILRNPLRREAIAVLHVSRLQLTRLQPAALLLVLGFALTSCTEVPEEVPAISRVSDLAQLAPGWTGEVVAQVPQSYAGWDVEIGDADGDGCPEILTGSAPDSRIYQFRKRDGVWDSRTLLDSAAGDRGGMVLGVRIVDLDHDGVPEIIAGTGQDDDSIARLHLMHTDGERLTQQRMIQSPENTSSYTHGLATADLDGDGVDEIVSAYCGHGEVIRYDVAPQTLVPSARKVLQLGNSGEDAILADVDGDGRVELIVSSSFRDDAARIEIHDLDPATGDPIATPRLVIDQYDGHPAFYASLLVGDLDGDGAPELIVGWKAKQDENRASLLAYRIRGASAEVAYVLSHEDQDLDLGYFEKMMAIADLDGDGRPELVVSTRGDGLSEGIPSAHLGHVFRYFVSPDGEVRRELVLDFDQDLAESAWLAVGDADGDGRPDLVLATGKGDRTASGTSWVLSLTRSDARGDVIGPCRPAG
ncbi:MAG: VCBS repeat-containing protein [Deltaproteobacteria bacterium]|nr:VCBS repeat-containing protein [Deltaproteobacteria bacterium]